MKRTNIKQKKIKYLFLNYMIFFFIIVTISITYWRIKERLSNENIIKYVNKEIRITLKEKSINDSISLNLQKINIPCDSFSIQTGTIEYDRSNYSDTTIIRLITIIYAPNLILCFTTVNNLSDSLFNLCNFVA